MKLTKCVVAISIGLALSGCGEQITAETHLSQAKAYIESNEISASVIELKNAIKLAPKNGEIRYILGDVYLAQGNGPNAVKEFERAKKLKFDHNLVIPKLARAYIISESEDEVIVLNEENISLNDSAQSNFLLYLTIAQLKSQQQLKAKESLAIAEKISLDSIDTLLIKAHIAYFENNLKTAKELVTQALVINPSEPEGLMLQGEVALLLEDFDFAAESFENYLISQPLSNMVRLLLSTTYLKAEKLVQAEKYADEILTIVPKQPVANYVKAMVRMQDKDYQKANEHAELALQGNFNQANLSLVAGASAFYLKNYERSYFHLNSIIKYLPADHFGRRMLAVSQLELGVVDDIADTISGVEAKDIDDAQFLSLLSYKLLEVGAYDEAKQLVDQASAVESKNPEQNLREGILKLMLNDPTAMDNLQSAVANDPELKKAELALAYVAVKNGDIAQAETIAKKWQVEYPEQPDGYNLQAAIYVRQQNFNGAKESLEKSLSVLPNNVFALTQIASILAVQNNLDAAKDYSYKALTAHPDNIQVLRQYFDLRRDDETLAILKEKLKTSGNAENYVLLYAEALTKMSQFNEVINQLSSIEPNAKTSKLYWQLKVNAYKQLNDANVLQLTLEKWRKTSPYHIEPIMYLADLLSLKKEYDRALRIVNQGLEQHKDSITLKLVKMQILLNSSRADEAESLLVEIQPKNLDQNIVSGIEGRIALTRKNYGVAATKLAPFYREFPTNQNAVYYAFALKSANKIVESVKVLESHLAKNSETGRINELLANYYIEADDTDKAIALYGDMVKRQPKNATAMNNLAWLKMEKGQLEEASALAKKAFEISPQIPNIADTYSQILFKQGKKREALDSAKHAYDQSKGNDVDIALNYIEVLIANSRKNEARKILRMTTAMTLKQVSKKDALEKQL